MNIANSLLDTRTPKCLKCANYGRFSRIAEGVFEYFFLIKIICCLKLFQMAIFLYFYLSRKAIIKINNMYLK